MTRLLVLGRDGQLARALAAAAPPPGWTLAFAGRERADLTRPETLAALVRAEAPDVVVNAAAFTAVDQAEREPELAFAVNDLGAGAAAEAAAGAGALLLHLSTDYVFDGRGGAPYGEDDPVAPLQVYGASKAAGEARVLAAAPDAQVVRTSWVVSAHGRNFLAAVLARAAAGEALRVVDDQRGRPTLADDLAQALLAVAAARLAGRGRPGRLHVTNAGEASWHELAAAALALAAAPDGRPMAAISPVSTAEYGAAAARPADSRLAGGRLAEAFGLSLRPWREALPAAVEKLGRGLRAAPFGVETGQQSGD